MKRLSRGLVVLVLATIFLSSGCVDKGPKVVVPELVGESEKAAEQLVMLNQLVFSSSEEYSDSVHVGDVISQNPSNGTSVPVGSVVKVSISKGIGRRSIGPEMEEVNTGGGWKKRCTAPWMGSSCPHSAYH